MLESQSLILTSIINYDQGKLLDNTFISTFDGRMFLICMNNDNEIIAKEMTTLFPGLTNLNTLKAVCDQVLFCGKYKIDYLSYDNEKSRLDTISKKLMQAYEQNHTLYALDNKESVYKIENNSTTNTTNPYTKLIADEAGDVDTNSTKKDTKKDANNANNE